MKQPFLILFLVLINSIYSQQKFNAISGAITTKLGYEKQKNIKILKSNTMKPNNIIFADLSTYTPKETIAFYENVFDWKYYSSYDYYIAYKNDKQVVGLYETPEKFKQMRMPHFWMTYIQVNDVESTVTKARELGGIIEMEQEIQGFGKVALIRDTQGAGFTVYQGENLKSTRTENEMNTLIWNELHISEAQKIIPFYEGIFKWNFKEKDNNHFEIYNAKNEHIANALEIPNEYKGKYEYWVCTFGVKKLQNAKAKVLENGGSIVIDEGERILCTDNSGQAFFYIQEVDQFLQH